MALYMCQVLHIVDFLGSRRMETAPTSIMVLLRPTQSQSDKPSDLHGSLSPTIVYTAPGSPGGHPSIYEPGATSLNFSDRANIDERTPYPVCIITDNPEFHLISPTTLMKNDLHMSSFTISYSLCRSETC